MRNLMLLINNNLKVTFRKKGNIVIYIFLPLTGILLSLLMYGQSFDGSSSSLLKIGFVNYDNGWASAGLKDKFSTAEGFTVSDVKEEEVNSKLLDFEIDAAVIIPENYTDSIYSGDAADIEIVPLKGMETTAWVEQVVNRYTSSVIMLSHASGGNTEAVEAMYEQVDAQTIGINVVGITDKGAGRSMTITSVGFLIMFMMLGTGFTSGLILKEKRKCTYHRVCSAPVSAKQYVLANSLTSLLICVIQVILILLVIRVLRIDTGLGSISLFTILLMFGFVAIGLGLVMTAFSSSSYMAGTLSTLIITPTCMLGGCYWDVSLMPEFMQKISYFVPQRWTLEAITKMQAGVGLSGIYLNLLVLAAFALAFILIAVYKFSRTNNVQKFV